MDRIQFEPTKQRKFIDRVLTNSKLPLSDLAAISKIHPRTLRDWRREKFLADFDVINNWAIKYSVSLDNYKTIKRDSFWYVQLGAKKGAKRRIELHGPPGTAEGRVKGGKISQQNRALNPEKYRQLGCKVRKSFSTLLPSMGLAEAFGIIMGDGGISNNQIRVSLSSLVDVEYSTYVQILFEKVFGEKPRLVLNNRSNCLTLTHSGVNLVEAVEKLGLKRGNKIINQISYPTWIEEKIDFKIACLRGLFDTDGGFYFHKKKSNTYMGWCFSSKSKPLLESTYRLLRFLELNAKIDKNNKIYIYHRKDISRYMDVVGSNNPKNQVKFSKYISTYKFNEYKQRSGEFA